MRERAPAALYDGVMTVHLIKLAVGIAGGAVYDS